MSRQSLIKNLKKNNPELTNSDAEDILNIFCKNIQNVLCKGKNIELRGFGTFFVRRLKAKLSARNPATGKLIYIPEKNKVRFRASRKLKNVINK